MIDLLSVYKCQNCGDVLSDQVDVFEDIDTENDSVEEIYTCRKCTGHVRPTEELQQVDHERWLWATGFYDDANSDSETEWDELDDPDDC